MFKKIAFWLAIAVLLIGGCHSQESSSRIDYDFSMVEKVAVVAVEGAIASETAKNQIADFFAIELLKKGYAPVERTQVTAMLKEEELEAPDLTTSEGAAEAGQVLNIPVVLVVDIPHFGKQISMTAKMIDVEDSVILWMGRATGKGGRSWNPMSGLFGGERTETGLGGEGDEMVARVMGDMLGTASGQPLSLHEAESAQSIIKKICSSVPSRSERNW